MSRTPGLGEDPSAKFDALQSLIKKAVDDSRDAIDTCAQALVWAAEDYELTDQAARDAYVREKQRVDS
ncbi:hypothetical protein ACOACQ_05540 [Nocardioides sp. CPCC 206347]|uniref:hypothetical protein n=1 Tax=unclassified Nocardioides TaxID=2615069 RepID=UPI00361AA8F3